ncbi:hypothetical protein [Glaciihabitans sp. dw_435]|uniref:hypothetical protein n=1 Tax=Glaciihabitans sp. dw_435 TaxID=2720081 RepID=UPI001BD4A570|nr:hypothetical protein [Glaciihabitans sp. dw_435]
MNISEIPPRPTNNHNFTADERLAILAEFALCVDMGQKSALCRRLGIDPRTPGKWLAAQREGRLVPGNTTRMASMMSKRERYELVRLQRENEALKLKLAQSESAVDVLGKASELLTALAKSSDLRVQQLPPAIPELPPRSEQPTLPDTFRGPGK